jgi:hypothetical protein
MVAIPPGVGNPYQSVAKRFTRDFALGDRLTIKEKRMAVENIEVTTMELIFVQRDWLENFEANPISQSRLVEICRMAMSRGQRDLQ